MEPLSSFKVSSSRVGADTMVTWLRSPITGNLLEVPGIGIRARQKLTSIGVTTTHQLLATFLNLKSKDTTNEQVAHLFWHLLGNAGISSHRSTIVLAVGEKLNIFIPGIFDFAKFENPDTQGTEDKGAETRGSEEAETRGSEEPESKGSEDKGTEDEGVEGTLPSLAEMDERDSDSDSDRCPIS